MYGDICDFDKLLGHTVTEVEEDKWSFDGDVIHFTCADGTHFTLGHDQDCCESVWLADTCGSWDDIIGHPILLAEESTHSEDVEDGDETWSFYKIATMRGAVTLRWCGTSNGYYSTTVDLRTYKK